MKVSEEARRWEVGETYTDYYWKSGVTEITDGTGYVLAFIPQHIGSARNDARTRWAKHICDLHNEELDRRAASQKEPS